MANRTEIITENIVNLHVDRPAGALQPNHKVIILNSDGREKTFDCTSEVAAIIVSNGYTHNKNRDYKVLLNEKGIVTDIVPGEVRIPRGLKLAVLEHNAEPSNCVVFRRDRLSDGSYGRMTAVKTPMGVGPERLTSLIEGMATRQVGESVGQGYTLFRTIKQAPGVEFYVLTK